MFEKFDFVYVLEKLKVAANRVIRNTLWISKDHYFLAVFEAIWNSMLSNLLKFKNFNFRKSGNLKLKSEN